MKKTLSMVALCIAAMFTANAQIVRTTVTQGEIEGEEHDGYTLFKAIPYAEAPVGNLRWKKPVAKAPWQGVYKAERWGNRPWQTTDPNQGGGEIPMSEDCLYLGIQTPAKSTAERLPVFVNIHGGGFSTGSYSGTQDSFIKEGIVYVSIEYRLGALGFMAHPELTKESPEGISGNYGIYDQIMALNWIHDNIAAFGGDPEKVTICGESAGGISVAILCASPLCKGLFRAAISESGSSHTPVSDLGQRVAGNNKTVAAAEVLGTEFQKKFAKVKNLKQLRKVSAEDIIKNTGFAQFWPVVDGVAIIDDQYRQYEEGNYNDVPVIVGYNSDEGSLFMQGGNLAMYNGMVGAQFSEFADKLKAAYPATTDQEANWALQDLMRDTMFGWGTWAWANLQAKTGKNNVYFYYFDQHSQNSLLKDCRGATHVAEMPFIYGWNWGPMTKSEEHMAQILPQYWINFIKNCDPNADGLPYWSTYKPGEASVMYMKEGFHLTTDPNAKQMEVLEEAMKAVREMNKK